MAQGTVQFFEEAVLAITDGTINVDTDSFKIALFPNTGTPTFAANDAAPEYATTYNTAAECSGTNYTAGGAAATVTYDEANGTTTFAISVDVTWTQSAGAPTDIYWGLLYSTTAGAGIDAIAFIDMGNAANISLVDGDITVNAGTVFTIVL